MSEKNDYKFSNTYLQKSISNSSKQDFDSKIDSNNNGYTVENTGKHSFINRPYV